jgi:hypothetical protein
MKRLSTIFLTFALLNLATSCQNDSSKKSDSTDNIDLSSPKATVQTFITAVKNKDENVMSKCIYEDAPREFKRIINKNLTDKELEEMSEEAGKSDIEILSQEIHGKRADVKVRINNRDSEIHLVEEDGFWLIANA